MKLREVGAAAALAAASILSVVGPPSEQFIYFHDKPPADAYKPIARATACADVAAGEKGVQIGGGVHAFHFVLPVTVHFLVDVDQGGGSFVPDEFFAIVVKSCHDA